MTKINRKNDSRGNPVIYVEECTKFKSRNPFKEKFL